MEFSFPAHVTLLDRFLDRRQDIVEEIERRLLNVQGKDVARAGDRRNIGQILSSCFFDLSLPHDLGQLKDELFTVHRADGFDPVQLDGGIHDFDPPHVVTMAYAYWTNSRWPGRNVRLRYAQTIYGAVILRHLEHLSLRIWDAEKCASSALQDIQRLLDRLNSMPGAFVRTATWLLQTAQGPLTRQLKPYFAVAERIAGSFEQHEELEIHRAGALLAGGHLRSQLCYRARESQRPVDDPDVRSVTRNSNSMDVALLIRDLVPLLEAYERACAAGYNDDRRRLSDAILQGLSADPELLLTRLDVVGPATMIEDVFIEDKDGRATYTAFGSSHLCALSRYRSLINALAMPLKEDASRLDPSHTTYSPFGIVYGFCSDILSNMAVGQLLSQDTSGLTLEDMFSSDGSLESKLSKAREWEALPRHRAARARFEHSKAWATDVFARLTSALDARATHDGLPNASGLHSARLCVIEEGHAAQAGRGVGERPQTIRAQEHCVMSDLKRALATGSTAFPRSQILSDRKEGRFLASVESGGKWFAVSKVLLTACVCQGQDAVITDVPASVVEVLRLTCQELLEIV
jgi:hypothetical protein